MKTKNTEPSIKDILEKFHQQGCYEFRRSEIARDQATVDSAKRNMKLYIAEAEKKIKAHYLARQDEVVEKVIGQDVEILSDNTAKDDRNWYENRHREEQRQTYKKLKEGKV